MGYERDDAADGEAWVSTSAAARLRMSEATLRSVGAYGHAQADFAGAGVDRGGEAGVEAKSAEEKRDGGEGGR